ncbi:MAG: hemerythrin domain-containing protein [Bacteroidota bacterium]
MAKRHSSLIELSRDHYHGLLLAVRLQQGKKALLRLWSHDPLYQAKFVVSFYENDLKKHFKAEEEALFPPIYKHLEGTRPLVDDLKADHRKIKEYVRGFRKPDRKTLEARLKEFGKFLEDHIRKEDRQLYPMVEKLAPPELLAEIQEHMDPFYVAPGKS